MGLLKPLLRNNRDKVKKMNLRALFRFKVIINTFAMCVMQPLTSEYLSRVLILCLAEQPSFPVYLPLSQFQSVCLSSLKLFRYLLSVPSYHYLPLPNPLPPEAMRLPCGVDNAKKFMGVLTLGMLRKGLLCAYVSIYVYLSIYVCKHR